MSRAVTDAPPPDPLRPAETDDWPGSEYRRGWRDGYEDANGPDDTGASAWLGVVMLSIAALAGLLLGLALGRLA